MEIPYERLKKETLDEVIKEFVLREGTDYGHLEWTLEDKKTQILSQLRSRKAKVVFDKKTETCSIIESESRPLLSQHIINLKIAKDICEN